jgi:uncharacterized membrane protein
MLRKLGIFLAILGPGIITGSVDNDAGGIATYSVAGAMYGYGLIWTLIPSFIVLLVIQEGYSYGERPFRSYKRKCRTQNNIFHLYRFASFKYW